MSTSVSTAVRPGLDIAERLGRCNGRAVWTLADQCVVSAANFLTNVYLARSLGLVAYGEFVAYYAILLYVWAWQMAFFSSPMMTIAPQMQSEEQRNYLRGVNGLQLLWSIFTGLVALGVGAVIVSTHVWRCSWAAIFGFAFCVVAFQLQDGLRRYYFVCGKAGAALLNDLISYGGQALALVLLHQSSALTVASALWAVALTSAAAVIFGAFQERLLTDKVSTIAACQRTWHMGRDLLAAVQLQWANNQGLMLIGAWMLGAPAAGAVRAMQSIAGPFNVLFQAMENVIPIRAAQHYATSGSPGLVRYLKSVAQGGAIFLGLPVLATIVFARPLVGAVYGASWKPFAALLCWHAAYLFISFLFRVVTYFFRTIGTTKLVTAATGLTLVVSVSCFFISIQRLGINAVLTSMVIGITIGLIYSAIEVKRQLARRRVSAIERIEATA